MIVDDGANTNDIDNFGHNFHENWSLLICKFELEENFDNQRSNLPKH